MYTPGYQTTVVMGPMHGTFQFIVLLIFDANDFRSPLGIFLLLYFPFVIFQGLSQNVPEFTRNKLVLKSMYPVQIPLSYTSESVENPFFNVNYPIRVEVACVRRENVGHACWATINSSNYTLCWCSILLVCSLFCSLYMLIIECILTLILN